MKLFLILVSMVSFFSCTSSKKAPTVGAVNGDRQAPVQIEDSFQVSEKDFSRITINKSSLGKAFLYSPSLVKASNTPILDQLQTKVVSFELKGNKLAMLELNAFSVYDVIPSTKILNVFEVENETEKSVSFRWSLALASISTNHSSVFSDESSTTESFMNPEETVIPVKSSFLRSVKVKNGALEIENLVRVQVGITNNNAKNGDEIDPKEYSLYFHFSLRPYQANPSFIPKLSPEQKVLGFIEVPRILRESGNSGFYANHWDLSSKAKPVTYVISKDTPEYLLEPMKEGILYWNRVAGREIVKVEVGDISFEMPQLGQVNVYWVPWSEGKFSRASMQVDPLTGEILSASIFITSFFEKMGASQARRAIVSPPVKLAGFQDIESSCKLSSVIDPLLFVSPENTLSSIPRRASEDMVRIVVAHEAGHTLGLRHNFSASLGSALKNSDEHEKAWNDYLNSENASGASISTSVMDYFGDGDEFLLGRFIKSASLKYDEKAIQYLYGMGEVSSQDGLYFCTDVESSRANILGCQPNDRGRNSLAGNIQVLSRIRESLGSRVAAVFLTNYFSQKKVLKKSLRQVAASFDPEITISTVVERFNKNLYYLQGNRSVLEVDRDQEGKSWLNDLDYQKRTTQLLGQKFDELGGLPGMLEAALPREKDGSLARGWLLKQAQTFLSDPKNREGKNLNGEPYKFSETEFRDFALYLNLFSDRAENAYLKNIFQSVVGDVEESGRNSKIYSPNLLKSEWQKPLGEIVRSAAFESGGDVMGELNGEAIRLPKARFPKEIRALALRIFSPKTFPMENWMAQEQKLIAATFENRLLYLMEKGANGKLQPKGNLSAEASAWLQEELELSQAFERIVAEK